MLLQIPGGLINVQAWNSVDVMRTVCWYVPMQKD